MSHEIRTPLNAIHGFIDLLKEEDIGNKPLQYVDIIDKSSQNLLQIIEDILDFSKIENGKLEIENIEFHVRDDKYIKDRNDEFLLLIFSLISGVLMIIVFVYKELMSRQRTELSKQKTQ